MSNALPFSLCRWEIRYSFSFDEEKSMKIGSSLKRDKINDNPYYDFPYQFARSMCLVVAIFAIITYLPWLRINVVHCDDLHYVRCYHSSMSLCNHKVDFFFFTLTFIIILASLKRQCREYTCIIEAKVKLKVKTCMGSLLKFIRRVRQSFNPYFSLARAYLR